MGRGRLAPPPVVPPPSGPRTKHTSQSPKVVIFFSPLAAAMLVPEHARETLVGLYRENSRFSRDLVGRAVVLDGGSLGSGDLGPATLFSSRQVVREGPGRVPWSSGALPARAFPARATAKAVPCGRPSGALYSSRPQAPATCRKLPRRPLSLGCNPLCRGSSFCPVTLFLKHSCLVYFSVACGCGVFPQSPKRKPSISACVRASLSYSLDHWLVLSTLAVDRSFWQCLESPSSLTVPEVRIKSLCTLCLLVLLRLPSRYSCF